MNGNTVHGWDVETPRAVLQPNGNLVVLGRKTGFQAVREEHMTAKMKEYGNIKNIDSKVLEYDWEGNIVWEYEAPGRTHHDMRRMANGNTIFLYNELVPEEYKKSIKDPKRKTLEIMGDCICEINPEGEVVWEWHGYEHLDLNTYCPADRPKDWMHSNTVQVLPENHWYDEGHKEFRPGNVIFNPRNFDTCMIIDRETKEVVWSYTGDYKGGLAHPHETKMIGPGLPGAGNILIFDDGLVPRSIAHIQQSFVLEINPVTKEIVWKYEKMVDFHGAAMGFEQRLPNGNTFIVEATTGRIFEVTSEKETVWEYIIYPIYSPPMLQRPRRYAYDHCPQLKALGKPEELSVTPPENKDWQLEPDKLRS